MYKHLKIKIILVHSQTNKRNKNKPMKEKFEFANLVSY